MSYECWQPRHPMTVSYVSEHHQALLDWLSQHGHGAIRMDLSTVSEIDTAGIQLLMSTRKLCETRGRMFELLGLSEVASSSLLTFGLLESFEDLLISEVKP
jgi:anti-anti-sigma regulatory factor